MRISTKALEVIYARNGKYVAMTLGEAQLLMLNYQQRRLQGYVDMTALEFQAAVIMQEGDT